VRRVGNLTKTGERNEIDRGDIEKVSTRDVKNEHKRSLHRDVFAVRQNSRHEQGGIQECDEETILIGELDDCPGTSEICRRSASAYTTNQIVRVKHQFEQFFCGHQHPVRTARLTSEFVYPRQERQLVGRVTHPKPDSNQNQANCNPSRRLTCQQERRCDKQCHHTRSTGAQHRCRDH
jgi:hypothetical protein